MLIRSGKLAIRLILREFCMYPRAFRYHRAESLNRAAALLSEMNGDAKILAGGQSLIPLMKLRFSSPANLVDIGFIPNLSYVKQEDGELRMGALARHAEIESSAMVASIPILRDCAAGIADIQVRNMGTIGGSLAEADPTGDWAPVLLTLGAEIVVAGAKGERRIPLSEFIIDAFTTVLAADELVKEIIIPVSSAHSGGCYLALKRCAPVYATAGVAVQLTMRDHSICENAAIVLGAVGLMPVVVAEAAAVLRGKEIRDKEIESAAEAASAAAQPQSDMRGSADYKRQIVRALTKEALQIALRRSRGEKVEVSHHYA